MGLTNAATQTPARGSDAHLDSPDELQGRGAESSAPRLLPVVPPIPATVGAGCLSRPLIPEPSTGELASAAAAAAAAAGEEACGEASLEQTLVVCRIAASIAPAETRARHGAQRAIPIGGLQRGIGERSAKSFSVREWEEAKREHEQGGGCVRALGSRASPSAGSFALQRVGTLLTWNLASCSWAR